jgi:hypothetical protein
MNKTTAILSVILFLTACGSYTYQNTHRGSLLNPPGYPAERHVTELSGRL